MINDRAEITKQAAIKTDHVDIRTHPGPKQTLGGVDVGTLKNKKALLYSIWDGVFASGMAVLVDTFAVAAAVYLNAPAIAIALLSSIPLLLSSIGQFFLPCVVDPTHGRKKIVISGTTIQSFSLLFLGCSGWLPKSYQWWAFLLFFIIYGFSGNIISSLWITWMGDLVPQKVRGRYFAWRNKILSITQLLCALAAGLIVRKYSTDTASWIVFAFVFFASCIFRWMSTQFLCLQYDPPAKAKKQIRINFSDLKTIRPFLYFCLGTGLMQGATALSGPFFNVWYVRDLHFDFLSLSAASAATVLGTILSLRFWGILCDSIGNRRILLFTGFLICTVPLPYVYFSQPWQICLLNLYSGISWSGYNLSYFNYVLIGSGNTDPEKKVILSIAINGVLIFIFSLLGGFLATRVPVFFQWQLSTLFLLSGILRLATFFLFFTKFPRFEIENNWKLPPLKMLFNLKEGVKSFVNSSTARFIKSERDTN